MFRKMLVWKLMRPA